jgi:hypothetical protein
MFLEKLGTRVASITGGGVDTLVRGITDPRVSKVILGTVPNM